MMYSSMHGSFGIFLLLRSIFTLCAAVGGIFLLAWTIKHMPEKKLQHLALWLLTLGIVGAIVMSFFAFKLNGTMGRGGMMKKDDGRMMWDARMMRDDGMMQGW